MVHKIRRSAFETNSSSVHSFIHRKYGELVKYTEPFKLHFSPENDNKYLEYECQELPEEKIYATMLDIITRLKNKYEYTNENIFTAPEFDLIKSVIKEHTGFDPVFTMEPGYDIKGTDCPCISITENRSMQNMINMFFDTSILLAECDIY